MKFTVDTNILVYLVDARDPVRRASAATIVDGLSARDCVLTLQSLAEFQYVAIRKRLAPRTVVDEQYRKLRRLFGDPARSTVVALDAAVSAWVQGRFAFWDAVLLATAAGAGCDAVISEDMGDGATLDRVSVITAFDAAGAVSAGARAALGLD